MGVEAAECLELGKRLNVQDDAVAPVSPRNAETGLAASMLRLLGGQELILDPQKAGPGGWSVRAGADGTKVFTNSLEGWTYFVIPPD